MPSKLRRLLIAAAVALGTGAVLVGSIAILRQRSPGRLLEPSSASELRIEKCSSPSLADPIEPFELARGVKATCAVWKSGAFHVAIIGEGEAPRVALEHDFIEFAQPPSRRDGDGIVLLARGQFPLEPDHPDGSATVAWLALISNDAGKNWFVGGRLLAPSDHAQLESWSVHGAEVDTVFTVGTNDGSTRTFLASDALEKLGLQHTESVASRIEPGAWHVRSHNLARTWADPEPVR